MPPIPAVARVVQYLGYDPELLIPTTDAQGLKAKRRELGWTKSTAARRLGIDPRTWLDWERGGTIMPKVHRRLVAQLIGVPEAKVYSGMRKGWNDSYGRPTREPTRSGNINGESLKTLDEVYTAPSPLRRDSAFVGAVD